ncbi:phage major capsid protein, partial [Bacillus pumilus]
MLREKIQELRSEITKRQTAINTKIKEAHQRAEEDKLDEAKTIKDEITSLKAEIETMTEKLKELEELAGMETEEITEGARGVKTGEERSLQLSTPQVRLDKGIEEQRRSFETFLRTRGEVRDGLTTEGAAAVIPIEVITTPQKTPEDIVDLAEFVNKVNVTAPSGSYPVLENTETELVSVAELEKNPELANPKFNNIEWKVETYRGQLAISQESIDDAGVDLTALVADHLQQVKRNTRNTKIAGVLKTFTA